MPGETVSLTKFVAFYAALFCCLFLMGRWLLPWGERRWSSPSKPRVWTPVRAGLFVAGQVIVLALVQLWLLIRASRITFP
jgi:hypothetical protein